MLTIKFKPYKTEWIGYVCFDSIPIFAELGLWTEVFKIVSDKQDELLQIYQV